MSDSVHVEYIVSWMNALRNRPNDRDKMLECFWRGQLYSKFWLANELTEIIKKVHPQQTWGLGYNITICGGWYGMLASILDNVLDKSNYYTSIDIDPSCAEIAYDLNKCLVKQGKFTVLTDDIVQPKNPTMTTFNSSDIIINTICEHLTQPEYEAWLKLVPQRSLVLLQSNNYLDHKDHVNCSESLLDFRRKSMLQRVEFAGSLKTQLYDRFMIIGYK